MTASIFAAFVLQQHELISNGVLTHQIMKFTESEDPACAPSVKLENVSMDALAEAAQRRIRDNNAYKFLNRRSDGGGVMVYAIPTVETSGEELDQFRFVSSHEGTKRVLSGVLEELGCEYARLSPDVDVGGRADSMATWTLTVSESHEYHELKLTPGNRCSAGDVTLHTGTAQLQINNVRLSEILYLAEYTHAISPSLVRYSDVPPYLGSKRTCERFKFPKTAKTSAQIVRDIQRSIGSSHVPLAELWTIVMDGVKFFI